MHTATAALPVSLPSAASIISNSLMLLLCQCPSSAAICRMTERKNDIYKIMPVNWWNYIASSPGIHVLGSNFKMQSKVLFLSNLNVLQTECVNLMFKLSFITKKIANILLNKITYLIHLFYAPSSFWNDEINFHEVRHVTVMTSSRR